MFLAITLGFFVDNYRDSYLARETVEMIAGDMVQDISADTTEIHEMLKGAYKKGAALESLCSMLDDGSYKTQDSLLYMYSAYLNRRILFERNNSSYNLLVSTGYLRYFSRESGSAITQYDIDCKSVTDLLLQERQLLNNKVFPFQQTIFNIDNFHSIIDDGHFSAPLTLHNWNDDQAMIYRNYISELKVLNKYIIMEYDSLLSSASATQRVLISEYGEQ